MEYRLLGRTGLKVPVVSFGASPLGSVFRPVVEADGIKTVHAALELGMNFFDVSPYYGKTLAETVLGKALKGVPRQSYILATKLGRYGDDVFDSRPVFHMNTQWLKAHRRLAEDFFKSERRIVNRD